MYEIIGQRELRNDNAEIMRRVEAGESFTVTRHGTAVADLIPHRRVPTSERRRLGEIQEQFQSLPALDSRRWHSERAAEDKIFGDDDPLGDPWHSVGGQA